MRRFLFGVAVFFWAALLLPALASAQSRGAQVAGFGGFTFGDTASAPTFGGSLSGDLADHVQVFGEVGRLADITPSLLNTVLDLTPVDLRVRAWYGEAGVRFIAPSHRAVRPYVEASAGMARLSTGLDGLNGTAGAIVDTSLRLLNRTEPLLGVGGGVLLQGGPLLLDLGYRYKKIVAGDSLQTLLNGGRDFDVSQARVGIGVRF